MYVSAVMNSSGSSSPSVQYLNGRCEKSTRAIVSVMIFVPNLSLSLSATHINAEKDPSGRKGGGGRGDLRLRSKLIHHLRPRHPIRKPREILNLGRSSQLSTRCKSIRQHPFIKDRFQIRSSEVYCRGMSCGS